MNDNTRGSFKSIVVLSGQRADNKHTGSMSINGGVNIKKNLYVKEEIVSNELITNKNARIGNNMYVMGKIESDQMFYIDTDGTMVFKQTIVPYDNCNIGTPIYKWNTVYTKSANIEELDANTIYTKKIVYIDYQEEIIKNNTSINIHSNTIFLNNTIDNSTIKLVCDDIEEESCIFVKVILENTVGTINLDINNSIKTLSKVGDYIELMCKDEEIIILNKN